MGKICCGLLMPSALARRNAILEWMAARERPVLHSAMKAALGPRFCEDAFDGLLRDGVIESAFPDAKPGDSGLQYWDFAHWTSEAA